MSNPAGKNYRTDCDLCGATDRDRPCENGRCGWRILPSRKKSPFKRGVTFKEPAQQEGVGA